MQNLRTKFCTILSAFVVDVGCTGAACAEEASVRQPNAPSAARVSEALAQSTKEQREAWRMQLLHAPQEGGLLHGRLPRHRLA